MLERGASKCYSIFVFVIFMKASIVNEITFYLSNQAGELAAICKAFSQQGVSIKGLLVSEGFGKSVVRVVVDSEDKAVKILEGQGLDDITKSPVLAVQLPSKIGVLSELSDRLGHANINIKNIYVTESLQGDTIAYVDVEDTEEAVRVINGYR